MALQEYPDTWAICGGVAASLYRDTPRFTGDIDIAIIDGKDATAQSIAERAQTNRLDYGFAHLPTILSEDLFVAKLFAFQGTPERLHDLDDV